MSEQAARVPFYRELYVQVLAAVVAGIILGVVDPGLGAQMKPLGDAFIKLIRMLIAPIIFCSVVHGIAGMQDMRRVGRVAVKALLYFEAVTTIALVLSLAIVDLWRPGVGMNLDPATLDAGSIAQYTAGAKHLGAVDFLMHIIPSTVVGAFAEGDILQVLFFAVVFAFALSLLGDRGKPLVDLIDVTMQTLFKIVGFVMWTAPIAAFGAMAFTVGAFGTATLVSLAALLVEFYVACVIFILGVLGIVGWLAGFSVLRLMLYLKEELLIILATTSSETVLPRLMTKLRDLGCDESVVGLVVPTGYSFNLDGTCLYLTTAAVFLAQATNTHLTLGQEIGLILVLLLTSKGAAGIAGAAFVVLAATLATLDTIPVASIALILGIHRFMSMALTFTNVVGNGVATIVVAKWEGALDETRLRQVLGSGRPSKATLNTN
ncbi:MAG: C4-dicarboxylate transporter DctA [Rhodospirillales bacterium]|nr:C4-dicarboxylate transporter DctA [Rhodospirillales bacterium]